MKTAKSAAWGVRHAKDGADGEDGPDARRPTALLLRSPEIRYDTLPIHLENELNPIILVFRSVKS